MARKTAPRKKATARKTTGKKPPKKASRTSKNTARTAPEGARLSNYQALVLGTLSKARSPMTRVEISEHTGITTGFCDMLGQKDQARRNPRSLWARGFVIVAELDTGQLTYRINAAGRKALKSAQRQS